jgi:hypothetical protein
MFILETFVVKSARIYSTNPFTALPNVYLAINSTLGPDLGISRHPRTFEIELDAYGGPVALSSQAGPPLPMKVQWNRCDPTSIRTQRTFYLHIFEAPEQFELPFRISKIGYNSCTAIITHHLHKNVENHFPTNKMQFQKNSLTIFAIPANQNKKPYGKR